MGMNVTTYKWKNSTDKQAANRLVAGFTGTLRNWWDNYLTDQNRADILDAVANKSVVKTEGGHTSIKAVEDATATLIYSIVKHFVGEPRLFQDRSLEILNNLYCNKLTDFRWYKDMFITKVMIREDCNNDYWKERFLSGLPPHFAEKVRSKIRYRCEGKIPYSQLSYGDLISLINFVAMELCTDLKLKEQLKKDQKFQFSNLAAFVKTLDFQFLNHLRQERFLRKSDLENRLIVKNPVERKTSLKREVNKLLKRISVALVAKKVISLLIVPKTKEKRRRSTFLK